MALGVSYQSPDSYSATAFAAIVMSAFVGLLISTLVDLDNGPFRIRARAHKIANLLIRLAMTTLAGVVILEIYTQVITIKIQAYLLLIPFTIDTAICAYNYKRNTVYRTLREGNLTNLNKIPKSTITTTLKRYTEIAQLPQESLKALPDNLFSKSAMEKVLRTESIECYDNYQETRKLFERASKHVTYEIDALQPLPDNSTFLHKFAELGVLDFCNPKYITAYTMMAFDNNAIFPLATTIQAIEAAEEWQPIAMAICNLPFDSNAKTPLNRIANKLQTAKQCIGDKEKLVHSSGNCEIDMF